MNKCQNGFSRKLFPCLAKAIYAILILFLQLKQEAIQNRNKFKNYCLAGISMYSFNPHSFIFFEAFGHGKRIEIGSSAPVCVWSFGKKGFTASLPKASYFKATSSFKSMKKAPVFAAAIFDHPP